MARVRHLPGDLGRALHGDHSPAAHPAEGQGPKKMKKTRTRHGGGAGRGAAAGKRSLWSRYLDTPDWGAFLVSYADEKTQLSQLFVFVHFVCSIFFDFEGVRN